MLLILSVLAFFGALGTSQDLSPPCIRSCYDKNPGPSSCEGAADEGGPALDDERLARCTCSTFSIDPEDPLYVCLLDCPVDEQTTYLQGWTDTTYGCSHLFPDVDEDKVDAGRSDPADGDEEASSTKDDEEPSQTSSSDEAEDNSAAQTAAVRSVPALLAAGWLVLAMAV